VKVGDLVRKKENMRGITGVELNGGLILEIADHDGVKYRRGMMLIHWYDQKPEHYTKAEWIWIDDRYYEIINKK